MIEYLSKQPAAARRLETQKILRAKYGIPPYHPGLHSATEHLRNLETIAADNGFVFRQHHEFEQLFTTTNSDGKVVPNGVGAVCMNNSGIIVLPSEKDDNTIELMIPNTKLSMLSSKNAIHKCHIGDVNMKHVWLAHTLFFYYSGKMPITLAKIYFFQLECTINLQEH